MKQFLDITLGRLADLNARTPYLPESDDQPSYSKADSQNCPDDPIKMSAFMGTDAFDFGFDFGAKRPLIGTLFEHILPDRQILIRNARQRSFYAFCHPLQA